MSSVATHLIGESWGLNSLLALGALGRILLIYYGRIQDYMLEVKFTDIDYRVYSDAAHYVANGESPYLRATYRYTPVLAWLLQANVLYPDFGKWLFSLADLLVGWFIYRIVRCRMCVLYDIDSRALNDYERIRNVVHPNVDYVLKFIDQMSLRCLCLWMFNPITIIISTRGNADVLVCAAVLATLCVLTEKETKHFWIAALLHGLLAIHLKLYPVIYLPSVFLALSHQERFGPGIVNCIKCWLTNVDGIAYCALCVVSAGISFYLCYLWCGSAFINESLLYHVGRVDVRHNFSPYFYPLYLAGDNPTLLTLVGLMAFVPQMVLVVAVAFRYARVNLPFCWFLSTFVFVSFNKVCTSQYFVWYLCLLPIVYADFAVDPDAMALLQPWRCAMFWFVAQGIWLFFAYLLEFHGLNTFIAVWLCSLLFMITNVYIMYRFVLSYATFAVKLE